MERRGAAAVKLVSMTGQWIHRRKSNVIALLALCTLPRTSHEREVGCTFRENRLATSIQSFNFFEQPTEHAGRQFAGRVSPDKTLLIGLEKLSRG